MAISYTTKKANAVNDGFSQRMKEISQEFAARDIAIFGQGFAEVLSDKSFYASYADEMLQGVSDEERDIMETVIENNRMEMVTESALGTISPVASLSVPTFRKSWTRGVINKVLPTEAVETPAFQLSYLVPYIIDGDGNKWELPENTDKLLTAASRLKVGVDGAGVQVAIPVTAQTLDLFTGEDASAAAVTAPVTVGNGDKVDVDFGIVEVVITSDGTANPETVVVDLKMNAFTRSIQGQVEGSTAAHKDTIFALLGDDNVLSFSTALGKITSFKVEGFVASTMNNYNTEVNFDLKGKQVNIPTAAHISAPVPTEHITDLLAQYDIDGVSKVIDIMANVHANRVDLEGFDFLEGDIQKGTYVRNFSAKPVGQFHGAPSEWRKEVRIVIDNMADQMINDTRFENGSFVLYGNPMDINLIPGIDWVFTGSQGENNGVRVSYSVGTFMGAYNYKVIATQNIPQGEIKVLYIPADADQMTYKYFPYSVIVENGTHVAPNAPHVPSIMTSRRQAFEKIFFAAGKVVITNNDAAQYNFV